jgi:hypothetical protein
MTRTQIQDIFAELNTQFGSGQYVEGAWLAMEEISEVVLVSDECIYPDRSLHVYFDGTKELVRLGRGHYDGDDFVVTRVEAITMYSQVIGFILSRPTRMKSPYKIASTI